MLTKDRDTAKRVGTLFWRPVAAGERIHTGALVALRNGYVVRGQSAKDLKAPGRANRTVVNTGDDGDVSVEVEAGVFRFDNDPAAPIDKTYIGGLAYILDDHTLSADPTDRSVAGLVVDVDEDGVWAATSLGGAA